LDRGRPQGTGSRGPDADLPCSRRPAPDYKLRRAGTDLTGDVTVSRRREIFGTHERRPRLTPTSLKG
jgi:hypothetical protein